MAQRITVTIPGPGPWGFRLAGGRDFNQPLFISKVTPGGKAHRASILENDNILSINGRDMRSVTHLEAQNMIKAATGNLSFNLERSAQATIWTPEVQQQQDAGFNVSLKANKQDFQHAGSSHNVKPRLFPGAGGGSGPAAPSSTVSHNQFNSPMNVYSSQNAADSYRGQTEGVDDGQSAWDKPSAYGPGSKTGVQSRSFRMVQQLAQDDERDFGPAVCPPGPTPPQPAAPQPAAPKPAAPQPTAPRTGPAAPPQQAAPQQDPAYRPGGTRSVRAPVAKPTTGGSKPANALPVCHKCTRNIMGPFVKVRGNPLHDTCFTCESCALSLRNKDDGEGFFVINEKLYCESCKNRIQQHQSGQVNGGTTRSTVTTVTKQVGDDEHVYQNGTSTTAPVISAPVISAPVISASVISADTYACPEPTSLSSQADSDVSSESSLSLSQFPDPPPFTTVHAPITCHRDEDFPDPPSPLLQSVDTTDSGNASDSAPSAAPTVLSSTPEPWNPNESYAAPMVRSVRAPKGKMTGKPPSTETSRPTYYTSPFSSPRANSNSGPEDGVKVMFVPRDHLGKSPSQVAGRKTYTTTTIIQPTSAGNRDDDMAAPPPPPPPPPGAGNYAWRSAAPPAPRPTPQSSFRPGGPPPAPKGQPPRAVLPGPPPNFGQRGPSPTPRGPATAPRPNPMAPPPPAPHQHQRGPPGPPAPGPAAQRPGGPPSPIPARSAVAPAAATSRTPYCETCNEPVRGTFVEAFGRNWHPEHFVCAHCHENLQGKGVIEDKGKIYCEDDYMRLYAPKCAKCMKSITGECVKAMGGEYHPGCFVCVVCNMPITGDGFHMQDGLTYCKRDFQNKFRGVNCGGCNFPIEAGEAWLEALDKSYHAECFTCAHCSQRLEGQRFYARGGLPYCQAHGS